MDMDRQRARLLEERERLERLRSSQETELGQSERERSGELSTFDQHPSDTASYAVEREHALSMVESLDESLNDVDLALQRIGEGTYGLCETCDRPIGAARLAARPAARFCLEHQEALERQA